MTGSVRDTYVAALQHDLVDLPEETELVGVVRRPTSWFHGVVDVNQPALGPPERLLDDVKAREEDLAMAGVCDEEALNAAWEEVDFGERYREYVETSDEAADAVADLLAQVRGGADVALVCYENTEKKRCHRTILREVLEERLGG